MMRSLFLLVNSSCDIACKYCFYTTGYEKRVPHRILAQYAPFVAQRIADVGFDTVILTGGDPFQSRLKHETYQLIRELKKHGRRVIVNTSAALLEERDLDTIVSLTVDRVDISIDSYDPEIHNQQRGCHQDAVNAIIGLLSRGFKKVATTTVVTSLNAPTLQQTIEWLRSLGVTDIRIQRAFIPTHEHSGDDVVTQSIVEARQLLTAPHTSDYIGLSTQGQSKNVLPQHAICAMGKTYFVSTAQGVLTPCFHRSDMVLGNLFRDDPNMLCQALSGHELAIIRHPSCFGSHCISLFDNPRFWESQP